MRYRLTRFGVHPTALIVAIIYFVLAIALVPIFYLASKNAPGGALPPVALIIGPIAYGVVGYVFTAIGCWLYNLVATWTGGIALTLEPDQSQTTSG